ncbi:class Ib ribonucleoside-diphosphate reductase assembly flavoprotein NrdI [Vibrio mimicus]|uniref:class Ib ribonucleoside-diphosphate reductase assembly flavoprotein NrdI n=1 Tax=Vibrio mimicus TaxID=674 RepID=UPI0012ACFE23|nr:class Ib ribonucleoside-diphosphate reductase assembly flavoprotein NrdI [Vibrio mimicus]
MSLLVYYSSASGNTQRFINKLGLPALRILIGVEQPLPEITEPFVLVCPTYADGHGRGAVPQEVIRLLKHPQARQNIKGVIGSGNRNFGHLFACSGKIVARNCQVPLLYQFELAGTDKELREVSGRLQQFWAAHCS